MYKGPNRRRSPAARRVFGLRFVSCQPGQHFYREHCPTRLESVTTTKMSMRLNEVCREKICQPHEQNGGLKQARLCSGLSAMIFRRSESGGMEQKRNVSAGGEGRLKEGQQQKEETKKKRGFRDGDGDGELS
jgi:hypothetical protein